MCQVLTRLASYLIFLALVWPITIRSQQLQPNPGSHLQKEQPVIGLLLPGPGHRDVLEAAEIAIDRVNADGGYKGQNFKLVVRTAEGFWGAGSKESVDLVYEDRVCVLIGSLDGRNGHLAEQVAAKSHLTYIETYATEPTLSQAFVPWFMRVVPNDDQQVLSILRQIEKEGGGTTGILSTDSYDTRYAVRSFIKAAARETGKAPLVIEVDTSNIKQEEVTEKILSGDLDHLVLPFHADFLKDLITALKLRRPDLRIYGTLHFTMGAEKRGFNYRVYEGIYLVTSGLDRSRFSGLSNSRSAYVYDAVNLVNNAIKQVGTDREAITAYLSDSEFTQGVTGRISFDEHGNRLDAVTLVHIRNGLAQLIKQP